MKTKASFVSFIDRAITELILYLKGKTNDCENGATFHALCPFYSKAGGFGRECGVETAGVT
jgi:hypothetical protein